MRVTLNSTVVVGSPLTVAPPGSGNLIVHVTNRSQIGGSIFASNGTNTVEIADGFSASLVVPNLGNLTLWTDGTPVRRSSNTSKLSEYLRVAEVNWGAATA